MPSVVRHWPYQVHTEVRVVTVYATSAAAAISLAQELRPGERVRAAFLAPDWESD